jgi:hypothetical protein
MTEKNEARFYVAFSHPRLRILRFSDRRLHALTALLMLAMIMAPAAAWSYQTYMLMPQLDTPLELNFDAEKDIFAETQPTSPAVADVCLPLLQSIHNPKAAYGRTQRPAGNAAAQVSVISLALGVRYALGPVEDTGTRGTPAYKVSATPESARAIAVAQYRDCHKKQALKALGSDAGQLRLSTERVMP